MSEVAHIPQLRFPEFSGDWEDAALGKVSTNVMYGVGAAATKFDGVHKYLRITDIDESSRKFSPNPLTSPEGFVDDVYRLSSGDIVFARTGASVGKSYLYNPSDGNLIFAGFLIKFNISGADPYFVYSNTFRSVYDNWVSVMSVRSGQPGINAEEYKLLPIGLPSKPEQQKIAAFLTAVDNKIEQLSKKQELLKEYKKGLMQKIFAQEVRFKADDGSEFADWEEKKLGDVGSFYRGHSYNSTNVKDDGLLVLRSSNIKDDSLVLDKDLQFVDKDCPDNISLKTNDIVICMANGSKNLVGKSGVYQGNYNDKLTVGAFCSIFRTNNTLSKYILQTSQYKKYLHILLAGTNINNLKNSELIELKFKLPDSVKEQTKIANFLSSIDRKIEQVGERLDKSKQFKKALLQQMFV